MEIEKAETLTDCSQCWNVFPISEIKVLSKWDEGVEFSLEVCPFCALKLLQDGWRE